MSSLWVADDEGSAYEVKQVWIESNDKDGIDFIFKTVCGKSFRFPHAVVIQDPDGNQLNLVELLKSWEGG